MRYCTIIEPVGLGANEKVNWHGRPSDAHRTWGDAEFRGEKSPVLNEKLENKEVGRASRANK